MFLSFQINLVAEDDQPPTHEAPPEPRREEAEFDYSTADIPRRDFRVEFGLLIIFPLVLMLVILLLLSYVMFGRREGV